MDANEFDPFFLLPHQPAGPVGWLYELIFERLDHWFPYFIAVYLAGPVLVILVAWSFTAGSPRAYFRVVMRSLALAFTFCFVIPFIPFLPPIPTPGWPFLFINSALKPVAWLTFTFEFALFHRWLWKRELRKVPGKAVFYEHQARNWWRPPEHWQRMWGKS